MDLKSHKKNVILNGAQPLALSVVERGSEESLFRWPDPFGKLRVDSSTGDGWQPQAQDSCEAESKLGDGHFKIPFFSTKNDINP